MRDCYTNNHNQPPHHFSIHKSINPDVHDISLSLLSAAIVLGLLCPPGAHRQSVLIDRARQAETDEREICSLGGYNIMQWENTI